MTKGRKQENTKDWNYDKNYENKRYANIIIDYRFVPIIQLLLLKFEKRGI